VAACLHSHVSRRLAGTSWRLLPKAGRQHTTKSFNWNFKNVNYITCNSDLVLPPPLDPTHTVKGQVTQLQSLELAKVLKPCNCRCKNQIDLS